MKEGLDGQKRDVPERGIDPGVLPPVLDSAISTWLSYPMYILIPPPPIFSTLENFTENPLKMFEL